MKTIYTSQDAVIYQDGDTFLVVMYVNELRCDSFHEAYELVMKLTRKQNEDTKFSGNKEIHEEW